MLDQVRSFLIEGVGDPCLGDTTDIFATEAVTSLFAMELVLFVESAFGITVENEDLDIDKFSSVQNLSAFVEAKLG